MIKKMKSQDLPVWKWGRRQLDVAHCQNAENLFIAYRFRDLKPSLVAEVR